MNFSRETLSLPRFQSLPRTTHTIWPGFESNARTHTQTPWLFTVSGCCTLSSLRRAAGSRAGWLHFFGFTHLSSTRPSQDVVCVCFGEAPAAPVAAFGCKNNCQLGERANVLRLGLEFSAHEGERKRLSAALADAHTHKKKMRR
jgi:hypothetical protein